MDFCDLRNYVILPAFTATSVLKVLINVQPMPQSDRTFRFSCAIWLAFARIFMPLLSFRNVQFFCQNVRKISNRKMPKKSAKHLVQNWI